VLPPQSLYVEGDSTRLSQVVANLLNNAAKYTSKGGHIYLTVSAEPGEVVIRVKDDGIGIAPDMLPHVFDLFTQADRRGAGGLGIGLALVNRLVQMHGGSVTAHSDGLGEGAELTVRLPLVAERRVQTRSSDDQEASFRTAEPRRVLVVDDNREAADSIAWLVSIAGHEVRTAYDGQEGLTVASSFTPDVLLLDLGMPGLTGYELARKIRHEPWGQTATLIAVTGWGQERDRRRVADAGFDAHLVKPVDTKSLLAALERGKSRSAAG
jgi:CheY-like chemotaxis protein